MRYIRLKEADKHDLEDWLARAAEIQTELGAEKDARKRKAIIQKYKAHWRAPELLNFLKGLSDGKCWYTEARFCAEYPHLEHFRPKSCARNEDWVRCHDGYWWLAFDMDNYRLSKPLPNTRKGTYFPLRERAFAVCAPGPALSQEDPMFLDPTDEDDVALIGFNSLGEAEPCAEPPVDLNDWDRSRIDFSILRYGLNHPDLCNQRKELWVAIEALFSEFATEGKKAKSQGCKVSAGKALRIKAQLREYLDAKREFTGLIRDCFDSHVVGKSILRQVAVS